MRTGYDRRAFTLLELLVAASLTLVLAGVMVSVSVGVLGAWRRAQAAHSQAATARQVFAQLELDLHSAFARRDSDRWFAVDILDSATALENHGWLIGPARMKPADGGSLQPLPGADAGGLVHLGEARFGLSGCWVRFVASNVESGGSLPVAVAYQLARRPTTGDPVPRNRAAVRYALYRSAVDAADTLRTGYSVTSTAYGSGDNGATSALASTYRQARNVMNPSHANLLAPNVVDFGVWLYRRESDGSLHRIFPASARDVSHHAVGQASADDSVCPAVVDVMVRILSEEGAVLLESMEGTPGPARPPEYRTDAEWWWAVVAANSRVFTARIEILGANR